MSEAPVIPVHLAEIIQDEMKERGWILGDIIWRMGPHSSVKDHDICKLSWEFFFNVRTPDVVLGDVMANQLATAFGCSAQFFTNFHENWRKAVIAQGEAK